MTRGNAESPSCPRRPSNGLTRREWLGGCATSLLALGAKASQEQSQTGGSTLKVGIAETSITPSWTTNLWGYTPPRFAAGVMDPVFAKAFLFDWDKRFLVIMNDLGAIGFPMRRRAAARIARQINISEDAIMIQCTHNHSAPSLMATAKWKADERFQLFWEDKLTALAQQAQRDLAPAELHFGQTESQLAANRRVRGVHSTWNQDSGPIDRLFNVLQVKSPTGKNRGIIVNYPTHGVSLRDDNYRISADFPGVLYRELGRWAGCPVGYMQGCCGDMIPKIFGGPVEMEEYGKKMAGEARRAISTARPVRGRSLDYASTRVTVTFVAPYTLDEMRVKYAELERTQAKGNNNWPQRMLRYLEDGGDLRQSRDTMVQALRLGDVALAILPGEILHLTAELIRNEFPEQRKLMVAAYSNDTSVGYLPHADEFPKGGYEVENAWKIYDTLRTTPDMERSVREAAVRLLRGVLS